MPQGPRQLEQNAQTLQQARGGRTPEEMARILGIARDALGDAASNVYDWLMPQDATDLGAELAPWGKAIGLIPPKLVKPLVERLRMMVRSRFREVPNATAHQYEISRLIDDYPTTAAHISSINPLEPKDAVGPDGQIAGEYVPIWRPSYSDVEAKQLLNQPEMTRKTLDEINAQLIRPIEQKQDWWGGRIFIDPRLDGGAFQDVLRHEFDHGAQDVLGRLDPDPDSWANTIDYNTRPHEIRARISEQKGQLRRFERSNRLPPQTFDYKSAMERELALLEDRYALDPAKLPEFNSALIALNEELKKSGHRLSAINPTMPVGPASMQPRRRFQIERIVLDR